MHCGQRELKGLQLRAEDIKAEDKVHLTYKAYTSVRNSIIVTLRNSGWGVESAHALAIASHARATMSTIRHPRRTLLTVRGTNLH